MSIKYPEFIMATDTYQYERLRSSEARIVLDIYDVVLKPGPNEIGQPMSAPCKSRVLDPYANSVKVSDISPDDVTKLGGKYQKGRMETFTSHFKATEDFEELNRLIARKENEEWSAGEDERKGKEKLE
ncbi:hypothetical protein MMC24_000615 [Lignoscripta atroalba]|nr:hypothetical protein [Lignoscripta atroalba]